ncbi:MAG: cupredoxin domain-containing protein [Rhodanobacteraceae bacterium]
MAVVFAGAAAVASDARAEAPVAYHLVLQNHKFEPATLKVPAGKQLKLLVTNRNPTPSEFESSDFNREKIVLPNSTITVLVGPLKKGTYKFFDDFHPATAGTLVVE